MGLNFTEEYKSLEHTLKTEDAKKAALLAQVAAIDEANKAAFDRRDLLQKQIAQKETLLKQQVENIYRNQPIHKFTARLSENKENVELYTAENQLVGVYTKDSSAFKGLEFKMPALPKQKEIILGQTKSSIFAVMESVFR